MMGNEYGGTREHLERKRVCARRTQSTPFAPEPPTCRDFAWPYLHLANCIHNDGVSHDDDDASVMGRQQHTWYNGTLNL